MAHGVGVGWPVAPVTQQHPIRGSFLDPRPRTDGPLYHTGVDISVRDDRPEPGHPPGRTHRVFALEAGVVWTPENVESASCQARLVRVGRFGYGHVDPVGSVARGERVEPGQPIGWTCAGQWHLHLSESELRDGEQVSVNPLRESRTLHPYVDTAPPVVSAIRFYAPADVTWRNFLGAVESWAEAKRLAPTALRGVVDIRAKVADPQSFRGWMRGKLARLKTDHVPYRLRLTIRRLLSRTPLVDRDVFVAEALSRHTPPFAAVYASGTLQNLSAFNCLRVRPGACDGSYWFHLNPRPDAVYWDTTAARKGDYELCVTAHDAVANRARSCVRVRVAN